MADHTPQRQYTFSINSRYYQDLLAALHGLDPYPDKGARDSQIFVVATTRTRDNEMSVTVLVPASDKSAMSTLGVLLSVVFDVHYDSKRVIALEGLADLELHKALRAIETNTDILSLYYDKTGTPILDVANIDIAMAALQHYKALYSGESILGLECPKDLCK